MQKSVKSKAEEQFSASQKVAKQFLSDKDKVVQKRADKMARLKALRMAKAKAEPKS